MVEQGRINPVTGVRANPSQAGSGICRSEAGEVAPPMDASRVAVAVVPQFGVQLRTPRRCLREWAGSGRVCEVRSRPLPLIISIHPHLFLLRLTAGCHFNDSGCFDPSVATLPSSRRQEALRIETMTAILH